MKKVDRVGCAMIKEWERGNEEAWNRRGKNMEVEEEQEEEDGV